MAFAITTTRRAPRRRPTLAAWLSTAFAAWRQRQRLNQLDAHILKDLGLTEAEIRHETARPFWDLPLGK